MVNFAPCILLYPSVVVEVASKLVDPVYIYDGNLLLFFRKTQKKTEN